MTPEEIVRCIDFRYITDALTPDEALDILRKQAPGRAAARSPKCSATGYPAYTTSAGWLGYTDDKLRAALPRGHSPTAGPTSRSRSARDIEDDLRRAAIIREEIGDRKLMMDANQRWDVGEAIANMQRARATSSPGGSRSRPAPTTCWATPPSAAPSAPIGVATGEHCQNRVIFKQLLQAGAIDFCQIDSCRLGGVNEVLAVLLMAAKFGVPVCPHAGGVGLCEYVQHLSIFDYICVSRHRWRIACSSMSTICTSTSSIRS